MAVYKRTYKTYSGSRTLPWSRFLILARYSYARMFQSRFLILFITSCLFYPIACLAFIYFSHNEQLLALLSWSEAKMPAVDRACRPQRRVRFVEELSPLACS